MGDYGGIGRLVAVFEAKIWFPICKLIYQRNNRSKTAQNLNKRSERRFDPNLRVLENVILHGNNLWLITKGSFVVVETVANRYNNYKDNSQIFPFQFWIVGAR